MNGEGHDTGDGPDGGGNDASPNAGMSLGQQYSSYGEGRAAAETAAGYGVGTPGQGGGGSAADSASGSVPSATGGSTDPNAGMSLSDQYSAYGAGRAAAETALGIGPAANGYSDTAGSINVSKPADVTGSLITAGKTVLSVLGAIIGGPIGLLSGGLSIAGMANSGAYSNMSFSGMGPGATGVMSGAQAPGIFGGSAPGAINAPAGTYGGNSGFAFGNSSPVLGFGGNQVNTPQAHGPANSGFLPGTILAMSPTKPSGPNYSYAARLNGAPGQPGAAAGGSGAAAGGGIDLQTALVVAVGAALFLR